MHRASQKKGLNPRHSGLQIKGDNSSKYIVRTDLIFENHNLHLEDHLFGESSNLTRSVLILGKPGAAKTTQAELVAHKLKWHNLKFGNCIRELFTSHGQLAERLASNRKRRDELREKQNIKEGGGWLDDDLCYDILKSNLPANSTKGIIIEGYPRSRTQTLSFEKDEWHLLAVIYLEISDELQKERLRSA